MTTPELNYDILQAQPVIVSPTETIELWVVGCGGTGSFLVQLLCRIMQQIQTQGPAMKLVLVDPDHVEAKNLTRQCFCAAEVGLNKAHTLASRYGVAWGLPIEAIDQAFDPKMVAYHYDTLTLLLGCVDNAHARQQIAKTLTFNHEHRSPHLWWIDGGNGSHHGQVLVGSCLSPNPADYVPTELGWLNLPAPNVQAPALMVPAVEESEPEMLSCAELTQRNHQGLLVNPQVAIVMAEMTHGLLTQQLKRFGVYFDQATGNLRSCYTTTAAVQASVLAIDARGGAKQP